MKNHISEKLVCFLVALVSVSLPQISAQGLKGSDYGPHEIQGRLSYIKGANDQERWRTFLDVQPKLIGMSSNDVDKALCGQPTHRLMSEIEYGLTEEPVKLGKNKSWLHVRVFFRDGVAWKYAVQASN